MALSFLLAPWHELLEEALPILEDTRIPLSHTIVPQIARKALEPPDMPEEDGEKQGIAPLGRSAPIPSPQHWSAVRCGCIEGVLATAIFAGQHADVWEAASMLLREHYRSVGVTLLSSLPDQV